MVVFCRLPRWLLYGITVYSYMTPRDPAFFIFTPFSLASSSRPIKLPSTASLPSYLDNDRRFPPRCVVLSSRQAGEFKPPLRFGPHPAKISAVV